MYWTEPVISQINLLKLSEEDNNDGPKEGAEAEFGQWPFTQNMIQTHLSTQ